MLLQKQLPERTLYKYDHLDDDLIKLHWLRIRKRIIFNVALEAHKSIISAAPIYFQKLV